MTSTGTTQATPASVLQLSVFTTVKIQSVPGPAKYSNFPVWVTLEAPGAGQTARAPIDMVAAVDVSRSIHDNERLEQEKASVSLVIDLLLPGDRLAVVPFDEDVAKHAEELVDMSDQGKEKARSTVKSLTTGYGTRLSKPLERAEQILMERGDVERAAFIILLSDGGDTSILKDKEWERTDTSVLRDPKYPVRTFGFTGHNAKTMEFIATRTKGTYNAIDGAGNDIYHKFSGVVSGLLSKATFRLFSAVGLEAQLAAVHPGVSLVRIESREQRTNISDDGRSGSVRVGAMKAGETTEFTVYLDVPEGDAGMEAMEVLSIGGVYTQGWDGKRVGYRRGGVASLSYQKQ
ncbi:uncharacterized protein LOC100842368 isoform X2 [Brachypodium distachyon]|nr:uncharacterized protein LOC100842368 isoform X2 [Brachypodium distachyon]KQJ88677.1 hypothetical protein BRADI_4g20520v3 [Brachypodium distachyon]|eukprot:XP_014757578.1 uncharacterized protein LOC100842368 isoform X2 [Brachypodium distachyon]